MDLQDKSLTCFDCGANYTFTVEEQQAFHARGFNHPPKRCLLVGLPVLQKSPNVLRWKGKTSCFYTFGNPADVPGYM